MLFLPKQACHTPKHKFMNRNLINCFLVFLFFSIFLSCSDDDGPDPPGEDPIDELIQEIGNEYAILSEFSSLQTHNVVTNGIYAIWWDPKFDHEQDLAEMFNWLNEIRRDCTENLSMSDPPNPIAGYYYNVYIHHDDQDSFPAWWGNGQGTDINGMPFLTLPNGAHIDKLNVYHEGFHIFQYNSNSPGFAYSGDSQWYIESTAQWYMADRNLTEVNTFIEAGSVSANPQLALWHSFRNHAVGDPTDWLYQVRQYGMHTYLYYLTQVAQVNPDIITGGFYAELDISPQQYHYDEIGGDLLRTYFADWAAANTRDFDYLTPQQWGRALQEVELAGDPNNINPYALTINGNNMAGTHTPDRRLLPRGWAYNVIKVTNPPIDTPINYTLVGNEQGSEGAEAHFESRIVLKEDSGEYTSLNLAMDNSVTGSMTFTISEPTEDLYIIIAAVPEHFNGNQTYDYQVVISM